MRRWTTGFLIWKLALSSCARPAGYTKSLARVKLDVDEEKPEEAMPRIERILLASLLCLAVACGGTQVNVTADSQAAEDSYDSPDVAGGELEIAAPEDSFVEDAGGQTLLQTRTPGPTCWSRIWLMMQVQTLFSTMWSPSTRLARSWTRIRVVRVTTSAFSRDLFAWPGIACSQRQPGVVGRTRTVGRG